MRIKKGGIQTTFDILSIGYELLDGRVLNTNARWLAEQISGLGGKVCRIMVVGDDVGEISSVIRDSIRRGIEWIITTGGLGPTYDDVTLQGVAKAVGRELVLNRRALEMLKRKYVEFFEKGLVDSPELTPHRIKMAMLPKGAKPLENEVGTAPGVLLKCAKTRIVCLPGVPAELEDIFTKRVRPILEKNIKKICVSDRWLIIRGIPESTLAPKIEEVKSRFPNVYIKSHPKREEKTSIISLYMRVIARNLDECQTVLNDVEKNVVEIVKSLGGVIVSGLEESRDEVPRS